MEIDRDDVLLILTVEDLEGVYDAQVRLQKTTRIGRLFEDLTSDERAALVRTVKKWIESWAGDAEYSWAEAISDGIKQHYRDLNRPEISPTRLAKPHMDLDTIDLDHDLGVRDQTGPFGEV
jgi:hypothetical protein